METNGVRPNTALCKAPSNASLLAAAAVLCLLGAKSLAHAQVVSVPPSASVPARVGDNVRTVAPALERYEQNALFGNLWRRPDLSPRDRSLVTLAALVARNQAAELPRYLDLALDSDVKPGEISELITHLAFYSGWGNALQAVAAAKDVFARRRIGADQLPPSEPELLPLDQAAEATRAARVEQDVRPVSPGLEGFTTDILFRDLWLRPGLAPRDRSLVTVSSLIASGQVAQVPYHLNRAMDNGLTRAQAGEVVTHLAFYAGWPNAFSAVPVLKAVLDGRRN
ncbi:carboxymuconolactone decarboxylase family protein [Belnapia sp. T18]|uniref:Carboxymuconolactone decarboxylase family protein n=1 Tax=Belnapia arida TaxID=2804533 RepID=A0ABS1U6H8_9PROT|nr:carboxymuconolactone decarboxylase family protein [Belnapia arida]